ncbi:hypothetical protein [Sphingopyxis sp.]|uniref:Gldg family protein n=1 Tax=Sphingopyxis sp. TaxID=1908224 RepID=UPI003A102BB5
MAKLRSALHVVAAAVTIGLLGWFAGGQSLLGRVDPALVVPWLFPPMLLFGWLQRGQGRQHRWRGILFVALAVAAGQAVSVATLASSGAVGQLALVACSVVVVGWLADAIVQYRARGRAVRIVAAFCLAVGWFLFSHVGLAALYRAPPAAVGAPPVTMLTGLPLRWAGGGDLSAMVRAGAEEDPALLRLQAAGPVRLVDSLVEQVPPPGGALLIAHPRALAPVELVAIDSFVRGGGRAVILADALSGWPTIYPLGDPRNPPVTSLLTPLLDHWGVTLGAAPPGDEAPVSVDVDGARLRLFSAGAFEALPDGCRRFGARRVAFCRIGQGQVWLVGDADLIFAPLWQPPVPGADHLRSSDTMEWLAGRLWGVKARESLFAPVWIRAAVT